MIAPITVWVFADDEEDARERVTLATIIATRVVPGREVALPPWKDWALASCVPDNSHVVAEGIILTARGEEIPISS
jgi:hypothetical protein